MKLYNNNRVAMILQIVSPVHCCFVSIGFKTWVYGNNNQHQGSSETHDIQIFMGHL